jgi:hypothetical protein
MDSEKEFEMYDFNFGAFLGKYFSFNISVTNLAV